MHAAKIARVAVDPALTPATAEPGGWPGCVYYRLHGSPQMYYSAYSSSYLQALTDQLAVSAQIVPTWCIFDNTALGAATANALEVIQRLTPAGIDEDHQPLR